MKLNQQEQKIYDFLLESGATLNEVIDVVIKSNGIIGVGLISLKDSVSQQIDTHERLYKVFKG